MARTQTKAEPVNTEPGAWICARCAGRASAAGARFSTRLHPVELPCLTCETPTARTVRG